MQLKLHMVTIEDLVPEGHFLRKLDAVLDLGFVYEETAHLYSQRYGRPPIDPVVLVKYLLVGFLYGIPSERQIEQRIQTDVALRWYLGLDLFDRVPDHSTISQLRRRKPNFRKIFRRLFEGGGGAAVRRQGAGQWTTGWNGFHPCEGQRIPGLGGTGGAAGESGSILGTTGRLRGRGAGGNWNAERENGGRSGSNRSKRIGVRPRSG